MMTSRGVTASATAASHAVHQLVALLDTFAFWFRS